MRNSIIDETLQMFAEMMEERFAKKVFTTEDSVRYTFFYCLTKIGNLTPSDIVLEQPHPSIRRAEIDMRVPAKGTTPDLFFEFKFDRAIPSEKNAPKPQKAGKIFADIMRLASLNSSPRSQRYLVYVTDKEMASYFMNEKNQLDDFFNLLPGEKMTIDKQYFDKHCETFAKNVGDGRSEIMCRLSKKFKEDFWLRVYEVIQS